MKKEESKEVSKSWQK